MSHSSVSTNLEFESRITYMKIQIKAWQWESSSKIMAFLNLYGKLQASELKEFLGLKGEKSIFKALKVLLEANKISKVTDETNPRISYYYSSFDVVSDPPMDEEFLEYLHKHDQLYLIADYFNGANMSSIGFIKAMTELLSDNILQEKSDKVNRFLKSRLFFESVLSIKDVESFRLKLAQFLQTELKGAVQPSRDTKKPLEDPVGFYIAFMPI